MSRLMYAPGMNWRCLFGLRHSWRPSAVLPSVSTCACGAIRVVKP